MGFKQSHVDHSLFIYKTNNSFVAALLYVDDVIIISDDSKKIKGTNTFLDEKFSIKDLGALKYFLGIEVACTREGLVRSQEKYVMDILKDSGMMGCKLSSFPMERNSKLKRDDEEVCVDVSKYRS